MRSRDKQRLRAETAKAVAELPLPYVIEAVAKQLDVESGKFTVSMLRGFLVEVTRTDRWYEYRAFGPELWGAWADETLTPAGLLERPPQVGRRRIWTGGRTVIQQADPGQAHQPPDRAQQQTADAQSVT
jgi:hypothetical protein